MKLIHHKLENGNDDPIEIDFTYLDFMCYLEDAMDFGIIRPSHDYDKEMHPSKVFLLSTNDDDNSEIIISNRPWNIIETVSTWIESKGLNTQVIHLQEYSNFQQAYEVAFYIREGHPLAYPPEVTAKD
jgi:hypothetical protein